jgi:hypothetical protein
VASWETIVEQFLHREAVIVLIVFGTLSLTGIAFIWGVIWHRMRQAEIDAALKSEMIQRGMSADEIQQVLEAGSRRRHRSAACRDVHFRR